MTDITQKSKRPLSPHLQTYRLPYNALMSIAGRMVGIGLSCTMIVTCIWFICVVFHPDTFAQTQALFSIPLVKYIALIWALAIFFYIGNGIRHFLWAIGLGVNEKAGILSGNIVLVISALAALGLWNVTINQSAAGQDETAIAEEAANE